MRLLSKGLTKITASITLSMIVAITSILIWTLITTATPNTSYVIIQQLKIESVMYNEQNNELIVNIRSNDYTMGEYRVLIYRINGKALEEIPINITTSETLNTDLMVVIVKLNSRITVCNEYILQLMVNNRIVREYVFKL
jgi:hypothetical protein